MEQGNLISWKLQTGEAFAPGDIICEIETDKAMIDYEAQDEGILAQIMIEAGVSDIPVGNVLAYTVEDESGLQSFVPQQQSKDSSSTSAPSIEEPSPVMAPPVKKRVPLIQFIGKRNHAFPVPATPAPAPLAPPTLDLGYTDIPLSMMRKIIAKRLAESKQTVPHVYSSIDCTLNPVLAYRKALKSDFGIKLSVNDLILKSVARALEDIPEANGSWNATTETPELNASIDISVAVATEAGLITPIVPKVQTLSLGQINTTFSELVTRARLNKLKPHEFQGGTFTISNLGGFGIDHFTAVINPPQACILAIGGGRPTSEMSESGNIQSVTKMQVTLSSDRRVVGENIAGEFLQAFQMYMEHPELLAV